MDDAEAAQGPADGDWLSDRPGRAERLAALRQMVGLEPAHEGRERGLVDTLSKVCAVALRVVPASGAGLSLVGGPQGQGSLAAWSGRNARRLEELQFSFGEGPCIEAVEVRRPALEPHLATHGSRRWPIYAPAACELGARAVFAVPLQVGAARLGVLDIYRDRAGSLTDRALRDVFMLAEVALGFLLDSQRSADATSFEQGMDDVVAHRVVVYQAQGKVMAELGIGLPEALALMKAHAFSSGRLLPDVARDIVDGAFSLGSTTRPTDNP